MTYRSITRRNPTSGALEKPWRTRDREFVLADPVHGERRHWEENATKVKTYGEALELVERGFLIRMSDGRGAPSLVAPASLTLADRHSQDLDSLWTYTMPQLPFTWQQLEQDLRQVLLAEAAEIHWLAGEAAAEAFIGFPLDIDEVERATSAPDINLDRFNLTRLTRAAYESAFRVGAAPLLGEEDVDELEIVLGRLMPNGLGRYASPMDRKDGPLRRTLLCAYLRWQISEGHLFEERLEVSTVEKLAVLAGMTEQAVRNSLNREGLRAVRDKLEPDRLLNWLDNRRDFVPLREDERPDARPTWRTLHSLRTLPPREALAEIRRRSGGGATPADADLLSALNAGTRPQAATVRIFASRHGLNADTLFVNFPTTA